jgi:hypothetical protein
VTLVFNPHTGQAIRVETAFGDDLGAAVQLDLEANLNRKRQRPHAAPAQAPQREHNVEVVYEDYVASIGTLTPTNREES